MDLDELEASLDELDRADSPEIINAALRNFLTDLTGNTHRAEFCIDKLFSPDSKSGRQGLVEFRAFEMPPHAQMSLAQMLLLRTLIAWFWQEPYRHPLIHWGTALHDRFLLPHYVRSDFTEVIDQINQAGFNLRQEWFEPFMEFRFPVYGRVEYDNVRLELRMALEPWLVLGEESATQREARVVDSALERLQVTARGLDSERHILTCNGRRVPLHATTKTDEYVAGVRYKAWQAGFGLHPTIEIHAPVVFDLHDRKLGRSIGGCVYHVAHPGGLAYEKFPINAYEAETRRISRFWSWGHSSGATTVPAWLKQLQQYGVETDDPVLREPATEPVNPAFPCTLDLRRVSGS
jgi:uncharacterized protein (DUF2126 family)